MRTAEQETNGATGSPLTTKSKVLETGASMVQVNPSSIKISSNVSFH